MEPARSPAPPVVGFLDSGVGGLTVWREAVRLLPRLRTVYLADNRNAPYGPRPCRELQDIVLQAANRLFAEGCEALVLACNTATAAAVDELRIRNRDRVIVGMEPAVKPAALRSRTRVVGVLATAGTLQGRLFRETSEQFAEGVRLVVRDAGDLVAFVERGEWEGEKVRAAVERHVGPMRAAGADCIVLGCTHFPFLAETIRECAGPGTTVLDPAPAVARQLARRLNLPPEGSVSGRAAGEVEASPSMAERHRFLCTGESIPFPFFLRRLGIDSGGFGA